MSLENIAKDNILNGMKKSFSNAEELLNEAFLLRNNKNWARAYSLSQLAIEELAKIPLLFDLLIKRINGYSIDYKEMNRNFLKHHLKTKLSIETEIAFYKLYKIQHNAEWMDKIIRNAEEYINKIEKLNDYKNESLYVTIKGNNFQSPKEFINEEQFNNIYSTAMMRKMMFKNIVDNSEKNIEEIARMIKEDTENNKK
jgi:AbiV family abortive infection protein